MNGRILPLYIKNVEIHFANQRIIGPINLKISGTGITIFAGPTGSGKTTLLRLIHGLEKPTTGSIEWSAKFSQLQTSFVFQDPAVLYRSTRDNIIYPLKIRGFSKTKMIELSDKWLKLVGLYKKANQMANKLSGGEIQKMAIARALITKPQLLFLDEPTSNLDSQSIKDIELIIQQASNNGTRIIMVTHDLGQIRRLADEVLFICQGKVYEYENAQIFFDKPKTMQAHNYIKGNIVL